MERSPVPKKRCFNPFLIAAVLAVVYLRSHPFYPWTTEGDFDIQSVAETKDNCILTVPLSDVLISVYAPLSYAQDLAEIGPSLAYHLRFLYNEEGRRARCT